MRPQLQALLDELVRLKRSGLTHVSVSDASLEMLRSAVNRFGPVESPVEERKETPAKPSRLPGNHVRVADAPKMFNDIMEEAGRSKPVIGQAESVQDRTVDSPASESGGGAPPAFVLPEGDKTARWEVLREIVLNDEECRRNTPPGRKVVFGVGDVDADLFFCGEAPGADEEKQGFPFVGPAGQLLTKMIGGMGLSRESVYIGNIMNWRPATASGYGNRPPTRSEMDYCLPYLRAQIEVVNPKVLVALGATAAKGLLGDNSFGALGEVRGQWHDFNGWPLMVTYHPSYLLRNATNRTKRMVWEDLLMVMERAGLPITDKQRGYFL